MRLPLLTRLEQVSGLSEELRFRVAIKVLMWLRDCEQQIDQSETCTNALEREIQKSFAPKRERKKPKKTDADVG